MVLRSIIHMLQGTGVQQNRKQRVKTSADTMATLRVGRERFADNVGNECASLFTAYSKIERLVGNIPLVLQLLQQALLV